MRQYFLHTFVMLVLAVAIAIPSPSLAQGSRSVR